MSIESEILGLVKSEIGDNVRDELADHLADVHKAIEEKFEEFDVNMEVQKYMNSSVFQRNLGVHIETYLNSPRGRQWLGLIIGDELKAYLQKLPTGYTVAMIHKVA